MNIRSIISTLPYDGELLTQPRDVIASWDNEIIKEISNAFEESDIVAETFEKELTPKCLGEICMLLMRRLNTIWATDADNKDIEWGLNDENLTKACEMGIIDPKQGPDISDDDINFSESQILAAYRYNRNSVIPRYQNYYDEWNLFAEDKFEQYRLSNEADLIKYDENKANIVASFCAHYMMYECPDVFFKNHLPFYLRNIPAKKKFHEVLQNFPWKAGFYAGYSQYCLDNGITADPLITKICGAPEPDTDKSHVDTWFHRIPEKSETSDALKYEMAGNLFDVLKSRNWFCDEDACKDVFIYRLTGLNGPFPKDTKIKLCCPLSEWAQLISQLYGSMEGTPYTDMEDFFTDGNNCPWHKNWSALAKGYKLAEEFSNILKEIGYIPYKKE